MKFCYSGCPILAYESYNSEKHYDEANIHKPDRYYGIFRKCIHNERIELYILCK